MTVFVFIVMACTTFISCRAALMSGSDWLVHRIMRQQVEPETGVSRRREGTMWARNKSKRVCSHVLYNHKYLAMLLSSDKRSRFFVPP